MSCYLQHVNYRRYGIINERRSYDVISHPAPTAAADAARRRYDVTSVPAAAYLCTPRARGSAAAAAAPTTM